MGHNYMYNELHSLNTFIINILTTGIPQHALSIDHCYEYETHLTLMHVSKYIYSFDFTIIISCFFAGHQESLYS